MMPHTQDEISVAGKQDEVSVSGRRWVYASPEARLVEAIVQRYQLSDIVAQVLVSRQIDLEKVEEFLNPSLRTALPDPSHLRDMDKAVERITKAIASGETIAVFGDYDVDGATSTALLVRFLRSVGAKTLFYIPDRLEEGYGPNAPAFLSLGKQGAKLIVTVDCGATAHEPVKAAKEAGLDVIIIDHHASEWVLPPADAVVNPNRMDENSPCRNLAAVGVVFLTCIALNRNLRQQGWYNMHPEPDLLQWLDLVALGTVCDVVSLTGLNRAFVTQGLKVMARRTNPGLAALADWVQITESPSTFHASHVFGPRINAGGRVGKGSLGAQLLLADDISEARELVRQLDELNGERRALEQIACQEAVEMAEAMKGETLLFVAGKGWHQGVIGIVASRLKDKYNLPVIIMTIEGDYVKGSGRSVTGVDLGAAVIAARQSGLLTSGGGHPMAAGLTTTLDKLEALKIFLNDHIAQQLKDATYECQLQLCGNVALSGINIDLIHTLSKLAPFGSGNPEPIFAIRNCTIQKPEIFGQDHVRCFIASTGCKSVRAVAYRQADDAIGRTILKAAGAPLHIAGRLRLNRWQGRESVDFVVEDVAKVWE